MIEDKTRVIGYFAFDTPMNVVCDGIARLVAGSEAAMKRYIVQLDLSKNRFPAIRKARMGDILLGMYKGGVYAFDEESYSRFFPLAAKLGIDIGPQDFSTPGPTGVRFVHVTVNRRT